MDKREFHRRALAFNFPVRDTVGQHLIGRLADISEGGFLIFGPAPLAVDQIYQIAIESMDDAGRPLRYPFHVKVRWCRHDTHLDAFDSGLHVLGHEEPTTAAHLSELMTLFSTQVRVGELGNPLPD